MGYIISTIVLFLLAVVAIWVKGIKLTGRDAELVVEDMKVKNILTLVAVSVCASIIFLSTVVNSIYQVPAGHIGIVYRFGDIVGELKEGLQFTAPWNKVIISSNQVVSFKWGRLAAFSKETQDVFIDLTLNVRVSPDKIQELFRKIGPDFFSIIVFPRVEQIFKDESVLYKSVDIAPNREKIRKTVRERLEKELQPYSIVVTDLLLQNIDFKEDFKQAIENKQKATQKSLEEEQMVLASKYKADQSIEAAKGEGQAILVKAQKQAQANRELAASLTPALIQYTMIQHLSPNIEVMILPAGQNFMLNSDMLKKKKVAASEE